MITDSREHPILAESGDLQMNLGNFPSAKLLLDHFFSEWLLDEGRHLLSDIQLNKLQIDSTNHSSSAARPLPTGAASGSGSSGNSSLKSPKKRTQSEIYSINSTGSEGESGYTSTALSSISTSSSPLATNHAINSANNNYSNSSSPSRGLSKGLSSSIPLPSSESNSSGSPTESEAADDASSPDTPRHRSKPNYDTIPLFYKPGCKLKPLTHAIGALNVDDDLEARKAEIEMYFNQSHQGGISIENFVGITKRLCGLPSFFNLPMCIRILELYGDEESEGGCSDARVPYMFGFKPIDRKITLKMFMKFYLNEVEPYDKMERFFRIIKQPNAEYITQGDFMPFIQELLRFHPGLEFLEKHDEFKLKYAITVTTRAFYKVNTSRSGKISYKELKRSDLYYEFMHVDEECDINRVTEYFSYEHFYVLYCRFFELDADKDTLLQKEDLMRYAGQALSDVTVERILQVGCRAFTDGFRGSSLATPKGLTYPDFIYFMLNEEDKTNDISLKYWFNICDLDGDGILSYNDMNYFYIRQFERLQSIGHEPVHFPDVLCQMMDMITPADCDCLTIKDFTNPEKNHISGSLFEVLCNLPKFNRFEARDPFAEKLRLNDGFTNEWNRFAHQEYARLSAEDQGGGVGNGSDDYGAGSSDYFDNENIDFDDDLDSGYSDSNNSSYSVGSSNQQPRLQLNLSNMYDGSGGTRGTSDSDEDFFSEDESDSELMSGGGSSRSEVSGKYGSSQSNSSQGGNGGYGTSWGGWSLADDSSDDDAGGSHSQKKGSSSLVSSKSGSSGQSKGSGGKSTSSASGQSSSSNTSNASYGKSGSGSRIVSKGSTGSPSTGAAAAGTSKKR